MSRLTRSIFSPGALGFYTYVLLYYLVQIPVSLFFYEEFSEYYGHFHSFSALWLIPIIVTTVILGSHLVPYVRIRKYINLFNPYKSSIILYGFAIVHLLFSYKFHHEYGISFRHKGVELSDAGGYVILIFALKGFFRCYVLLQVIKLIRYGKQISLDKKLLTIILVGFYYGRTGSLDALNMLIFASIIMMPKGLLLMLLEKFKFSVKQLGLILFFAIITFAGGFYALYIGNANKIGHEKTIELLTKPNKLRGAFVQSTILRLSHTYSSFITVSNSFIFDYDMQAKSMTLPILTMQSRAKKLLGLPTNLVKITSINRVNFVNIHGDRRLARAGGSPGLFATFFFLPFFPFNIIIGCLLPILVIKSINRNFDLSITKVSPVTGLLLSFIILPIYQSPIDNLFNFISPMFIYFVCFIFATHTLPRPNLTKQLSHE